MMKWFLVFLAVAVMDFVWALYAKATVAGQAVWASSLSVVIILLSGFSTIEYTREWILLIPAGVGAFVGTLIAMKVKK